MNPLGSCYSLTDDVCLLSRYTRIQWVVNRLTSGCTTGRYLGFIQYFRLCTIDMYSHFTAGTRNQVFL